MIICCWPLWAALHKWGGQGGRKGKANERKISEWSIQIGHLQSSRRFWLWVWFLSVSLFLDFTQACSGLPPGSTIRDHHSCWAQGIRGQYGFVCLLATPSRFRHYSSLCTQTSLLACSRLGTIWDAVDWIYVGPMQRQTPYLLSYGFGPTGDYIRCQLYYLSNNWEEVRGLFLLINYP